MASDYLQTFIDRKTTTAQTQSIKVSWGCFQVKEQPGYKNKCKQNAKAKNKIWLDKLNSRRPWAPGDCFVVAVIKGLLY